MAKIINVVYKVDDKALLKAKTEIQGIEKETKDSEKEMLKLDKAVQKVGNDGGKSFLNFKNILGTISVVGIVASLTAVGKKIFDLGVKQEQLNIAFNTFLGSAAKGKALLAELTKFSIVTPFSPDQVNNAAKSLLAFGVQGKEVIPILKMLGDVSSGTGKDLGEMAIIFGQIKSTGRLMGQDLLQLINAGFNPLQVISEKTGKSMRSLKDDMEKGLISFDMVSDAFKTATSEGGLFFNLMEKQSQTIGGLMSTIEGNVEEGLKNIFTTSKGPLKEFVDQLVTLSEAFMEFTKSKNQLVDEKETSLITDATKAYSLYSKAFGDSATARERIIEGIKEQKQALANQSAELLKVANQEITLADIALGRKADMEREKEAASDKVAWLNEQSILYDTKVIPALDEYILAEELAAKATKKEGDEVKLTAAQLEAAAKVRKKALDEINKQLGIKTGAQRAKENADADEKESKRQSDAITREIEQDANRAAVLKANNKDMEDEKTRIAEEAATERIRIADEEAAKRAAAEQRAYDLAIQLSASLLENTLMQRQIDTDAISDKYERELELAGDNDRAKEEIEKERDAKLREAERRNKEIQKKNARTKIGIDTLIAVIKTFSEFGYPAGILPAALMTAVGAVAANKVGKFKDGGWIEGPGTSTSDSVPILASKDEFMVKASAAKNSGSLLEAINDRKIDDRVLHGIAANGGRRAERWDDSRIVDAINKNKVDYIHQGYTLYKSTQAGKSFKRIIRSKVQGY